MTASSVTIKQNTFAHAGIADILNKLQAAATSGQSGGSKGEKNVAEEKIDKVMEKQMTLDAGKITWENLFGKIFAENKVSFLVAASAIENGFNPSAMVTLDGKKEKLREMLEPLLAEHRVKLDAESSVVVISAPDEEAGDFTREVYSIRKFLKTSTAAQISARIQAIEGIEIGEPVELGPFAIIGGSPSDHQKISAAIAVK